MNLKDNLKRIRKENNLSQEELAEKLKVSRQSVSKWEQGITYPEMDKMLEICKLFNLNIDDLLNGDVKETNNTKQAKNNINKFIESFLGYVSKTADMFSSMKFKNKLGCIIEQILIIVFLHLAFNLIGSICENILADILYFLPSGAYHYAIKFFGAIYTLATIILGAILLLYIFKIRYLDYYEVVDNEEKINEQEDNKEKAKEKEESKKENKVYLEKKKEKIIIRDPKHSEYRFISGLVKVVLFIFKFIALFIFGGLCITLIILSLNFVLSFILIKTGLVFIGVLLMILACMLVNYVFLKIFYAFIFNGKLNKNILVTIFIASLVVTGFGAGLIALSIPEYSVVKFGDKDYYITEEETINMDNNMFFINEHNLEYIESNNKDIRIEYMYAKNSEVVKDKVNNGYYIRLNLDEANFPDMLREFTKALNDKKILLDNDSSVYIKVYTNKTNLEKLKGNLENYKNHERELSCEYNKHEYISRIDELQEALNACESSHEE